MENSKEILAFSLVAFSQFSNVYTAFEGLKTGKIKVYTRTYFRFFGAEPIFEYSMEFEPSYFWTQVCLNLFWPILLTLAIIIYTIYW